MLETKLTSLFQGVTHPIISAPMCGMSMGRLAGSVAAAGGVGLIGIGASRIFGPDRVRQEYNLAQQELGSSSSGALGFGFIESFMGFASDEDDSLQACLELTPDVVFLSGFTLSKTQLDSPKAWIELINEKSPSTKVIVQTFSVSEAVTAARCGADVVVIQGCDAGGHGRQHETASSIVSLVPQARLALNHAGFSKCLLVAAGGIATGTQMAAALTLGADGVLMGSAFVVAKESQAKDAFKDRILATNDGTAETLVSDVWDHLSRMAEPFLKGEFSGRALKDSEAVRRFEGKHQDIHDEDRAWYGTAGYETRAVWCSSSVGLLQASISAKDIVEKTASDAIQALTSPHHFKVIP